MAKDDEAPPAYGPEARMAGWEALELDRKETAEPAPLQRAAPRRSVQLGPDRVVLSGRGLLVDARRANDGWELRPHRPTVVRFEGRSYALKHIRAGAGGRVTYQLEPWDDQTLALAGLQVDFDLDYVQAREAAVQAQRHAVPGYLLGVLASPLLGLLWADTKAALERRIGLEPVRATHLSVYLIYALCLTLPAAGMLALLFTQAKLLGLAGLLTLVPLVPDVLFRKEAAMLGRDVPQLGFLEWLRPSFLRARFTPPPGG